MNERNSDKLVEEAMDAAIEWLNFFGQESIQWGNQEAAEGAARTMARAVDVRDEARSALAGKAE